MPARRLRPAGVGQVNRLLGAVVLLAALGLAFPIVTGLALAALLRAVGAGRHNRKDG